MSSSLGPVIATIFMVELESILIHKLNDPVKKWKGLVNNYVLSALILFHDNKRPTEKKNLPSLNVLFPRYGVKQHRL